MNSTFVPLLIFAIALLAAFTLRERQRRISLARQHRIRAYVFPDTVFEEFAKTYPHLGPKDAQLVARALRTFFIVHARAPRQLVGMPSKAVDAMWHAFILDTRAYRVFCQAAFGSFFHHVPATAMKTDDRSKLAMWRTWRMSCLEENINPVKATRLPLLFALDAKLSIPDAVHYNAEMFKKPPDTSGGCGGGGCGG